jgi:hypothetical protein
VEWTTDRLYPDFHSISEDVFKSFSGTEMNLLHKYALGKAPFIATNL